MKSNIIVYTNIYDTDENFIKYTIDFAKSIDARITFCDTITAEKPDYVTVEPIYGHASEMPVYDNRIEKVKEIVVSKLDDLCKRFSNDWPYIDYEVLTDVNYIGALKKVVKRKQARYVLISKIQEPSFWDKWLGTVSTTIAEELNVPTILIPQNQKFKPFTHILHQIELDGMDLTKLKNTLILSNQLNAKITAAYFDNNGGVSLKMFKNRTSFLNRMVRYPLLSFKYYESNNLNESLNTLIQASNVDMIVLRHHQESLLNRIFNMNHTDRIVLENDIPFIIY